MVTSLLGVYFVRTLLSMVTFGIKAIAAYVFVIMLHSIYRKR
jgi:hypothetical protein